MVQLEKATCEVCGLVPIAGSPKHSFQVVVHSPAMEKVLERAARFAASEAPVVITGETGSGKEVLARLLHRNSSRADRPFVAVNVAALPAELLESELFGHGKGAFTGALTAERGLFEEANGGTLFLDEIGEMPLALQAKLLRALQDGEIRRVGETRALEVDVRILCATHRDLADLVRRGAFREDLYFRLQVLTLRAPPLRERKEDILPLASRFLAEEGRGLTGFSEGARALLLHHSWPGNVRELQNAVRHGAALAKGPVVEAEDLPENLARPAVPSGAAATWAPRPLAEVEREHILRVLESCGGSRTEAAKILGIARNTLWRKLDGYA